jgi:hypothetical protein
MFGTDPKIIIFLFNYYSLVIFGNDFDFKMFKILNFLNSKSTFLYKNHYQISLMNNN